MGVSWDFWCRGAFCTTGARWSWIGKKIFLDNNQVKIKQMTLSRVQALQRENTD